MFNIKRIARILAYLSLALFSVSANSAEPLLGAFGKNLGNKYSFDDVLAIVESENAFIVQYDYLPPSPVLSTFHLLLTPVSYQIYGIMASDQLGNDQECKEWVAVIGKTVIDKYYNEAAGDNIYKLGEQDGILLKIKSNGRWIKLKCDDAQLTVSYSDPSVDAAGRTEFTQVNNLRSRFFKARYAEIVKELQSLSDKGVLQAQTMLGFLYRKGRGVTRDNSKAEYYYTQAASKNYPTAMFNLGTFLMDKGRLGEAEKWLLKGSEMGMRQAQYNLGQLYAKELSPPNYREAFRWFRESAEKGHVEGQYNTCHMYSAGDGVTRNEVQAYMWCDIAARSGHGVAQSNRDHIAKRMSPEQIAQARELAVQWRNQHSK